MKIKIYPDETVYSMTARMRFKGGESSVKKFSEKIYGHYNNTNHILWPTRLSNLSRYIKVDQDQLLQNHTLYPYYATFLSQDKKETLESAIMHGKIAPSIILGLLTKKPELKLCPVCIKEDMEAYGEAYWHRSHQLPGTIVCDKHNVFLITQCSNCNEKVNPSTTRKLNVTPLFCSKGHSLSDTSYNTNPDLLLIAQENYKLLITESKVTLSMFHENIRTYLIKEVYQNVYSSSVQYNRLIPSFLKRFPEGLLEAIGAPFKNNQNNWIKSMFWNKTTSINPLHFILLMLFFANSVDNFYREKVEYLPFGRGPWPCLNITCCNYMNRVIKNIKIEKSNRFGKPTGVFECDECGFNYTRTGPDTSLEDQFTYHLIRKTGTIWDAAFEELLKGDVVYIKHLAKKLNVGTVFIRLRLKDRLGDINLVRSKKVDLRKIQRERLLKISQDNPELSRKELFNKEKGLIHWIYINDREWLNETFPSDSKPTVVQRRGEFITLRKQFPNATRSQLQKLNRKIYKWLSRNDRDWFEKNQPAIKTTALKERRETFVKLVMRNPNATRTEFKNLDRANYQWLLKNDKDWFEKKLPSKTHHRKDKKQQRKENTVINQMVLHRRRKDYLELLRENPNASRNTLKKMNFGNYAWLLRNDRDWFDVNQPPKKHDPRIYTSLTLDQRREKFLLLLNQNPIANRKELREKSEGNYQWLLTNDRDWLLNHLPPTKFWRDK